LKLNIAADVEFNIIMEA